MISSSPRPTKAKAALALISVVVTSMSPRQVTGQTSPDLGKTIYANTASSVFLLVVKDASGRTRSQGTGFLVDGSLVVTNQHVVSGSSAPVIDLGVAKIPTTIERADASIDLALLKINAEVTGKPLRLSAADPSPGEAVYVIGNPRGLERSISSGLVSGVRDIAGQQLIQISAPISPGSSGGPVLNAYGEVVGVSVAMLRDGQNLNFAIPASVLRNFLAAPTISHRAPFEFIDRAIALRNQQSQIAYSSKENSEYQQLEAQIVQQWKDALMRAGGSLRALDMIATEAHFEDLDVATEAAEKALGHKPTIERQEQLAVLLWKKFPLLENTTERRAVEQRSEKLLRLVIALKNPPSPRALRALGSILEDRTDYTESLAILQKGFRLAGTSSEEGIHIIRSISRVLFKLNKLEDSKLWFERLVAAGKASVWDWRQYAERLVEAQNYVEAGNAYFAAAKESDYWEDWCDASFHLSAATDKHDAALETSRNCISKGAGRQDSDRKVAWGHIQIGRLLVERGVYESALNHGREATALLPENAFAIEIQADALCGLRRFQECIRAAKQAIQSSDGKYSSFHFRLGTAYFETEQWELARQSFEKVAELNKQDAASPYNVALCMERLGFYRDAIRWYEEALRRDPKQTLRDDAIHQISVLRRRQ